MQIDHFSQASLKTDLQLQTFRSTFFSKYLLLLITTCLALIAGVFAGLLGSLIARTVLTAKDPKDFLLTVCVTLMVSVWLIEISYSNLLKGLWKSILTGSLSSLAFSIFLGKIDFIAESLFFNLVGLIFITSSSLMSTLSFSIVKKMEHFNTWLQKQLKYFCNVFMIFTSIAAAYWLGNKPGGNGEIFSGLLISLLVAQSSSQASQNRNKSKSSWFFESWAIAIASWGGTSFYNLDLSEIDFTGSKIANTDFRAKKFYRTCLKDVKGLEKARVDNRYFDLDDPKVQKFLTKGSSEIYDFSRVNLRGAYLQNADMRQFNLTETNLDCADLSGADLRESVLLRTILTSADLSRTDLTGACIKDWSFNQQTQFDGIVCDYVYREYEDDRPTDRYPPDRNFEPGEFQSLFQKLTNAVELVFKDQVDWRALSFTFDKFRLEDDGLELELKGVEQRGDYWIVKVTHKEGIPRQEVEQKVIATYEDLRGLLAAKDQQINRLMGIMENQTSTLQNQSEALRNYSEKPFGNSFVITGSTITNLAGSGQIEYAEAANQVRNIVAQGRDPVQMTQKLQQLLGQFQQQSVATTPEQQAELLRQLILSEAESDEIFKGFLQQQGQQILQAMPPGAIASAVYSAIEQLG